MNIEKMAGGIVIAKRKRPLVAMWRDDGTTRSARFILANPDDEKAVDGALRALSSGDRRSIDLAGRKLEQTPVRLETEFQLIPLLASLGRTDAVFSALDLSLKRRGFTGARRRAWHVQSSYFRSPLRAAWNDPRFKTFLQKAGFFRYWQTNHVRPDACLTNAAPLLLPDDLAEDGTAASLPQPPNSSGSWCWQTHDADKR